MLTCTANEAKTRFGEFLDRAQREPVGVMRHDRVVVDTNVLLSAVLSLHGAPAHGQMSLTPAHRYNPPHAAHHRTKAPPGSH